MLNGNEVINVHPEEEELLLALNPTLQTDETGKHRLVLNIENFRRVLDSLKTRGEQITLQSDLLGLRCTLKSTIKDIGDLKTLAEDSMKFMEKQTGTHTIIKTPLGVG